MHHSRRAILEAKPKLKRAAWLFTKGTLKIGTSNLLDFFHYEGPIYLKGERIISSVNVLIPKYEVPILAAMKKKIVTNIIDVRINIQDGGSNSFRRFQVGLTLAGYLENQ